MKKIVLGFAAVLFCAVFVATEAEARRLGGARSLGTQRNITNAPPAAIPAKPAQAQAPQAAPAAGQPVAASGMSKWAPMLARGRDRMLDAGSMAPAVQCDAEHLPFGSASFDCVSAGFGLRNMTHKDAALAEMARVLKPGGRLLVLEFSQVWKPLQKPYDLYSFHVLPWLGEKVARDAAAYRYLAESIRMHPDQPTLAAMLERSGLERVEYFNLAAGVVAVHRGYRF